MFVLTMFPSAVSGEEGVLIQVDAGSQARQQTPVSVPLPKGMMDLKSVSLQRLDDGKMVPGQIDRTGEPRVIWLLEKELPAGQSRRYRLIASKKSNRKANAVTIRDDGKTLQVFALGKPVLHYNQATVESPDPKMPFYARSGYIHPLFNPAGQVLTDDFAPDHPHQHGVFFAWTNTTFEGRDINFWDQKNQQGSVEHVKVTDQVSGPVFGGFTAILQHVDLKAPGGPKAALTETWRVRVYALNDHFLFDLESVQRCASESPLQINKYHYGAMAVRGRREWLKPGAGDFLTSEGKTEKDGNHTQPRWVDIFGDLEGSATGVTLFGHPDNFRYPQPVRLHPTKPYFCFAPLVSGPFEIQPGEAYTSRYRFFVHNGKLDVNQAEQIWRDYTDPVIAKVVAE
jgi:hypothetical protein